MNQLQRARFSYDSVIRLHAHLTPSSVSKLLLFLGHSVCRRSNLLTGGGERGVSLEYDRKKAWTSINHSILSGRREGRRYSGTQRAEWTVTFKYPVVTLLSLPPRNLMRRTSYYRRQRPKGGLTVGARILNYHILSVCVSAAGSWGGKVTVNV